MDFPFTPRPPLWQVNWPAIRNAFAWIRDMAGVCQEPEWHAEGDVEVHTRLVAHAMAADPRWRSCDEPRRNRLFAAALLHDVAKPQCTRQVEGRWTSPRHAKVGERLARTLLWSGQCGPIPSFAQRESVAKLVRYHGLPLTFIEKPEPDRAIIEASMEVNLQDVAILAMADVLGRECRDRPTLTDKVELFTQYCDELDCLNGPKPFASDHHRFIYFAARKPYDYIPFDASTCTVTLMSGLPGSGKSTWARQHAGALPILCLDALRQDLAIDPGEDQGPVVQAAREEAKAFLRSGRGFCWDATNITRDLRSGLVALFANYGARVRIVYVESPWEEMLQRNRARRQPVPEQIMHHLAQKLEVPSRTEAHGVDYILSTGLAFTAASPAGC